MQAKQIYFLKKWLGKILQNSFFIYNNNNNNNNNKEKTEREREQNKCFGMLLMLYSFECELTTLFS